MTTYGVWGMCGRVLVALISDLITMFSSNLQVHLTGKKANFKEEKSSFLIKFFLAGIQISPFNRLRFQQATDFGSSAAAAQARLSGAGQRSAASVLSFQSDFSPSFSCLLGDEQSTSDSKDFRGF